MDIQHPVCHQSMFNLNSYHFTVLGPIVDFRAG